MFSFCVKGAAGAAACMSGPAWLGLAVVGNAVVVAMKAVDAKASDNVSG